MIQCTGSLVFLQRLIKYGHQIKYGMFFTIPWNCRASSSGHRFSQFLSTPALDNQEKASISLDLHGIQEFHRNRPHSLLCGASLSYPILGVQGTLTQELDVDYEMFDIPILSSKPYCAYIWKQGIWGGHKGGVLVCWKRCQRAFSLSTTGAYGSRWLPSFLPRKRALTRLWFCQPWSTFVVFQTVRQSSLLYKIPFP